MLCQGEESCKHTNLLVTGPPAATGVGLVAQDPEGLADSVINVTSGTGVYCRAVIERGRIDAWTAAECPTVEPRCGRGVDTTCDAAHSDVDGSWSRGGWLPRRSK